MAAHQRRTSTTEGLTKVPHLVSLKVLRLSRPRLAQQYPIPPSAPGSKYNVPVEPSLSLPPTSDESSTSTSTSARTSGEGDADGLYKDHQFTLTPLLSLPPAFGSTYVGETFACTLCANNELRGSASEYVGTKEDGKAQENQAERRSISGVRMVAEMQTPSNPSGIPLSLGTASSSSSSSTDITTVKNDTEVDKMKSEKGESEKDDTPNPVKEHDAPVDLAPGETLLRTVQFDLREPGTHYLAVTITYDERQQEEGEGGRIIGARVRSFRKLYQFVAQTLLGVRTKAGEMNLARSASKNSVKKEERREERKRFALEAQVENLGDVTVVLEGADVIPKSPFTSKSLNWDAYPSLDTVAAGKGGPTLNPRDVMQLAFVLEETDEPSTSMSQEDVSGNTGKQLAGGNGRKIVTLGQLSVRWRGPMGEKGSLRTGWLTGQKA